METLDKKIDRVWEEVMDRQRKLPLCEGINYNTFNNTVEFVDDGTEDNVDTSLANNPIKDTRIVNGIPVWSIFKRKSSPYGTIEKLDGNPLLYAMKNIGGWRFVSKANQQAFEARLEAVVDKFLSLYNAGITVVVPSGGSINQLLANIIKKKAPQSTIIGDVMRKLTTEEVWQELCQLDSPFRRMHGKTPNQWKQTTAEMLDAFKKMNMSRNGYFTYHLTPSRYRGAITTTLGKDETTCAQYVPQFVGKNILIIDDSISRGSTIRNACNIIQDFEPNSITVLTLFSKKYPAKR
mgnify:CR=1 FL=1